MAIRQISVRVPPKALDDLDALAGDKTRSHHIRMAICEYVLRRKYDVEGRLVHELAQRALSQGYNFIAEYIARRTGAKTAAGKKCLK